MEFWGVEVKPGQTVKCDPGAEKYVHLSQASLGESKKDKGSTSIPVFVNVDGKKLVIGTLSPDKCAQISYDLVFEKEFELSHSWKDGSVFFVGYKTLIAEDESDGFSESDSEDEKPHAIEKVNGKSLAKELPKVAASKPSVPKQVASASKAKPAEEPVKPKEHESEDEDVSEDEFDEDESGDEEESDQEMGNIDESDEDESSDEEETVTPKKTVAGKKRLIESDSKASVPDKKAKLVTPAKTGAPEGKKGGHTATPHPSKHAAKMQANDDKSKQQTPKSGGSFSCKSCTKSFNSDAAVQSHTKAKHAAK